ncbi:MAG TPA: hypothetical protein DIT18_09360 [Pseudomonas sp.]|nr:hypothetical protein [Pseudomonas sp.]
MKRVYLINNVKDGGKTYLGYLLPALNALRHEYDCVVLQTALTGLSTAQAEDVLDYPVEEVELDYIARLKSQTIISNDAFIGRALDESNFAIFISHGNVGMPIKDKHYASSLMSFFDAIVSPSRSFFSLLEKGLALYRHDRQTLELNARTLRSDLRKTSVISTLPVKLPDAFDAPPAYPETPGTYVVGILPTQKGICPEGGSLFENMVEVINATKAQIPHARIILRPYMTDLEHPYIQEMCHQLSQYPWISIDQTKGRSEDFYRQCDTVITDASSGGVSFMLNTCRLPIYYVPSDGQQHPIVGAWLERMANTLPIARNGNELKDLLHGFELLTSEQHFTIYKNFYESEFGGFHPPQEVFLDLVKNHHDCVFREFSMAADGSLDQGAGRHGQ